MTSSIKTKKLLDSLCAQAHWAPYRSWPILLWGPHYGVFVGLALAAAERPAGMFLSHGWERTGSSVWTWETGLTRLGLAWVTGLVFLASNSLWACLLVHTGLVWALFPHLPSPSVREADPADRPV